MRKRSMKKRVVILGGLLGILLMLILLTRVGAKPVRAACTWGDVICDTQQAMQQLLDNYVTPLKAWMQLQTYKAVYGFGYSLIHMVAGFMWSIAKVLTTVSVGVGVIADWIAINFFQPMIQMTNATMKPIMGVFFFIAFVILGISYLLAVIVKLNVVNPRNMFMWWIAGGLFFSVGPNLYTSMRNFNQSFNSLFYAASLNTVGTQQPFAALANGDSSKDNPVFAMPTPCNNFTGYLPSSTGKLNGIDVSLSFQKADGFDIVTGGDKCLGAATTQDLPRRWFAANGYFDAGQAPDSWLGAVVCPPAPTVCDYDVAVQDAVKIMQAADNQAVAGVLREWQSMPLVWFGMVEQLVGLCLIVAQGLTFISFGCAMLFAFFKRTEAIAWAVIDQWLSLIVQTIVVALVQAMIVMLYINASKTGSPLIVMAVSFVGLVFMVILLLSGLKAVWSSFNKLFEAFGQASGGVFMSPGAAAGAVVGTAVNVGGAAVTGGLSLASGAVSAAGAVAGGVNALGSGSTWAQAAGVALGGSQALDGAAFQIARMPGLRDTALGEAASQYMEGSATRRVGESVLSAVPGVGGVLSRLGGATLGSALLTDHNPDNAEARLDENGNQSWQQPMLRRGTNGTMSKLLAGPTWEDGQTSSVGRGGTALRGDDGEPFRRGDIPAETRDWTSGWGRDEKFTPALQDADAASERQTADHLNEEIDDDLKRDLTADRQAGGRQADGKPDKSSDDSGQRLTSAATKLEASGEAINRAAEGLGRSVQNADTQRRVEQMEGRLTVSGANNVGNVMERTVDNLRQQNMTTGQVGANNEQVSAAMAGAMQITPIKNESGQVIEPIEGRMPRYQMFADQALQMGLSGQEANQVVREVKASPDGRLSTATRDRLVHQQHDDRGEAWADSVQSVRELEHSARNLPNVISAYGTRPMPASTTSEPVVFVPPSSGTGAGPVVFTPTANQNGTQPVVFTPPKPSGDPVVFTSSASSTAPTNPVVFTPPASTAQTTEPVVFTSAAQPSTRSQKDKAAITSGSTIIPVQKD